MSSFSEDQEAWVSCAPGTLAKYAAQHRRKRRRRVAVNAMGVALMALLALVAGWGAMRLQVGPQESHFGGIACHDVEQLMPQYLKGEVAADVSERTRRHLAECPDCQEMLRRLQQVRVPGSYQPFAGGEVRLATTLQPRRMEMTE